MITSVQTASSQLRFRSFVITSVQTASSQLRFRPFAITSDETQPRELAVARNSCLEAEFGHAASVVLHES